MYSIADYGGMIADRVRMDAYVQALRRVTKPDSVVLDIGTGTGIFALLACQFGARRVYALEPNDAIQLAREMAAANGYADRITFIQMLSTQVTLPEPADVIVSDIRSLLPFFQHHLPSIVDARKRFLAPGGILIPQRDTVWAAVAEAAESYARRVAVWDDHHYGLEMSAARRCTTNALYKVRVAPEQLLVEPKCWATLDYATVEGPNACAELSWSASRAGTAHGLSMWFDTTLCEGVQFSNAPGAPAAIYANTFFPWPSPVSLAPGDAISLTLRADLIGEDYLWRWDTRILRQGQPNEVLADFTQSTFFASPLSPERLAKLADSHVPTRNEDAEIDHFILAQMDGRTPLGEIARRLTDQFPSCFARWQDALTRVGKLSQTYSR